MEVIWRYIWRNINNQFYKGKRHLITEELLIFLYASGFLNSKLLDLVKVKMGYRVSINLYK
jgi:hypothetical protein